MKSAAARLPEKAVEAATPHVKRRPAVEIAYIGVILAVILLGIVQTVMPIWHFQDLDERRQPAPIDDYLAGLRTHDPQLPAKASQWFDDRFGFRPILIRLHNEVLYRAFGTGDRVYIGKDGFLFSKALIAADKDVSRTPELVERTADSVLQGFRNLRAELAGRGIRLVVVSIPPKQDFYRQYLPADAPPMPDPFLPHRLRERLKREAGLIYVDASIPLEAARTPDPGLRPLYYRTDPHMGFWGARVVAPAIADAIAEDAGMTAPPWPEFHNPYEVAVPGGAEQRFLGLMTPLMEHVDSYRDTPVLMRDTDTAYWEKDPRFRNTETIDSRIIFEFAYHARPDHLQGRLPPIVVYGDSFADHLMVSGFLDEVAAAYRSRQSDIPLAEVVRNIPDGVKYFMIVYNENVAVRYAGPPYLFGNR